MSTLDTLRPCDKCGGTINPAFYKLAIKTCVIDSRQVREHVGLAHMLGSDQLASMMGTSNDEAVKEVAYGREVVMCLACCSEVAGAVMSLCEESQ